MVVLATFRCSSTRCRSEALVRKSTSADLTAGWVCAKCGAPARSYRRTDLPAAPPPKVSVPRRQRRVRR